MRGQRRRQKGRGGEGRGGGQRDRDKANATTNLIMQLTILRASRWRRPKVVQLSRCEGIPLASTLRLPQDTLQRAGRAQWQ